MRYLKVIWIIFTKDILLEVRSKDIIASVFVFSVLVVITFNFALDPTPSLVAVVAPGILWVAFIFGGVLGLTRSFAMEKESGGLESMLLLPCSRDALFFGKMLANVFFMIVVEIIIFPVFVVLFDLTMFLPGFILVAVLATLGISAIGTVCSAMAVNTRSREVMLPVLFLPLVLPLMVAAVECTAALIATGEMESLTLWISFLMAVDAIFLVVCPFAFCRIVET